MTMTAPHIKEAERTGGQQSTILDVEFCDDLRCPGSHEDISICDCGRSVHSKCREVCEKCGEIGCINCMVVIEKGFICQECE